MVSGGEVERGLVLTHSLRKHLSLHRGTEVGEVIWKMPILWLSADENWIWFLIIYPSHSVNYFTLNKVLVSRAQLLHRFFHELQSLCLFKLHLLLSSLCWWRVGGWGDTWTVHLSSDGLLWLSLVSYCNFCFWAPGALRLKIVPVIIKDILTGVKLIVKSGTFESLLYLALISDSFAVAFQMSDVSF